METNQRYQCFLQEEMSHLFCFCPAHQQEEEGGYRHILAHSDLPSALHHHQPVKEKSS